jgi:very-short-patch-repair endonuclease
LWETFPDAETLSEAIYLLKNNMLEPPECPSCEKKLKLHKTLYRYGIYCDMKCRSLKTPLTRISVSVNGKIYPSIKDATEETGISRYLLKLMLFDSSNSSCFYVKDHESTTQTQLTEMSSSLLDKQMLIQKKDSGMAMDKIAEEIGVSRDQLAMAYAYNQISTKFNQIPEATGMLLDDKEWLESQYKTMSAEEIGERNGVSSSLILQKLHHHGIEIDRTGSESKIERQLVSYIRSLGVEPIQRDRTVLSGKELDIVIPSAKLAIELDGLFYHATGTPVNKVSKNHQEKQELCASAGYTLLRFVDVGETSNPIRLEIIKSIIASKIGRANQKLYARQCQLVTVESNDARMFFEQNHMSGFAAASIYIGLVFGGELVQCMSFAKPRFDKSADWEIIRSATKTNTNVVGGMSKIFKRFLSITTGNVMTYANLRFGSGAAYEKIGFEYSHNTNPGYFYTDLKKTYSRQMFQKGNIQSLCPEYDPTKSEGENALTNGFFRYNDCGNAVFYYKR